MERVDRYENGVVVLILDLDDFLHRAVAAGNAHETNELPHPVIDVNDVVSGFKLADFLESERHFCVPGVVGTQIVLVEAVKDLMIGVKRGTDRRVAETSCKVRWTGGEKCTLDSLNRWFASTRRGYRAAALAASRCRPRRKCADRWRDFRQRRPKTCSKFLWNKGWGCV